MNHTFAQCHPERPHEARGLCKSCYDIHRFKGDFGINKPSSCHPKVRAYARTLCLPCYAERKKLNLPLPPRTRVNKIAKCHPEQKHYSNGLCRDCYLNHLRKSFGPAVCHPNRIAYRKKDRLCRACVSRKGYQDRGTRYWRHGTTREDYEKQLKKQDYKCAICGRCNNKFVIDHDHKTGGLRGILCVPCNAILGQWKDSISIAQTAFEYLSTGGVW